MENLPPKKTSVFTIVRKILIGVFLIALIFSIGYGFGLKGYYIEAKRYPKVTISREIPIEKKDFNFSLFWKVWDALDAGYYDKSKLIPAKMVYGAIKGMVSAVGDPYTAFLPPEENKVVEEDLSGSFQGVGIQIGFIGNQLAVIAPLPDSPAEKAGVKAGDFIVGLKDVAKKIEIGTVGISLPDAVQIIRGPKGTQITLTLLRDGSSDPLVVDVTRDELNVPSVVYSTVGSDNQFAHIKLLKFGAETKNEWDKAVVKILTDQKIKGIILDVRNNPGGYLQGAVDLASDFLEIGDVVVIEQTGDGKKEEFKVDQLARLKNRKLVVLMNKGSASASEILAGALRDQKHIKLIGDTSFGKGTIQEPQQIENGAGLHITVAKWLTPNETWVNEKGLEPDIKVEDKQDTTEDEQLLKAIEELEK